MNLYLYFQVNGQLQIFVQYRSMADIGDSYEVVWLFVR